MIQDGGVSSELERAQSLELKELHRLSRNELLRILVIRNEDGIRRNMYTRHVISEAEHFAWVQRTVADPSVRFFAVVLEGEIIGATTYLEISKAHKRAIWGAYLGEDYRGRGLGGAMEAATLDHAFGVLGLEKLNGEVMVFNTRALKVHLGLGFVSEGIRRRHILRDGEWIDVHMIGITREEWEAKRASLLLKEAT